MRIGITGAYGQFGYHLRCRLFIEKDVEIVCAGRETFGNDETLRGFVEHLDAIVHLAGVNRAAEAEVEAANPALARQLVEALEATDSKPHLVYSSTTHIDNDSAYGRSKRKAGDILANWASRVGANCTDFVFPHLFGEYGRPEYNSAVSTFCWKIAKGEKLEINGNGSVELLHFHEASQFILDALRQKQNGQFRPKGTEISVPELARRIDALASSYRNQIVPDLRDPLDLRLFNVYRGFLYPDYYPVKLVTHTDDRGSLTETVKTNNGGQTFFSTTKPGITRGNHFHFHKVERFLVVRGKARISLRKMLTDEVQDFFVSGENLSYIDMPTLHTHEITNIGDEELTTLFWSHEIYDPDNPDTVFDPVRTI